MNMASSAQAYQQQRQLNPLQLQAAEQTVEQARQLNPLQLQAQRQIVEQAARVNPELLRSATAAAGTAETGQSSANLDFANKQVTAIANRLTSTINDPLIIAAEQNPDAVNPEALYARIKNYGMTQAKEMGIPEDQAIALIQPYLQVPPAGMRQFLKNKLLATLDASSRLSAMQPTGVPVSSGAGTAVISTNIFGGPPVGTALLGTTIDTRLPPGTELTAVAGDASGYPPGTKYLKGVESGTVPGSAPTLSPTQRPAGSGAAAPPVAKPFVTGQAPGEPETLRANAATASADWATTSTDAGVAQQRIATLQKIRQLAPDAFTGVGGARKELIAGLANAIGIPAYEAEKTATDELRKNANLLALAGGNTDAARALAEMANPNTKMNAQAIKEVVNQLIGIESMKAAKAKYLGQYRTFPDNYIKQLELFNNIADSRLFQEMTREEVAKMKASLSETELAELSRKIRVAKIMGVIK
ncbi:hypothetical protein UFOVP1176_28 [uncultured Caudovirales phage]|uniref:Uncharacterized protein n=1 Tax=uncultured Caudovirales phage TaxID=2100421 RepID=A0A6J5RAA3_9CAUD|nr:hypothetical protein UFOVP1176_28 [uncultured Caudovirales phage]